MTTNSDHETDDTPPMKAAPIKQLDLFIPAATTPILRDVIQHMEHPFFALTKRPPKDVEPLNHNPVTYSNNKAEISIVPGEGLGRPTIYDKDVLIYCVSQIVHAMNQGQQPSRYVQLNPHDLLTFTARGTGGASYQALVDAIERLFTTSIKTTIKTGGETTTEYFRMLERAKIVRKNNEPDGRIVEINIGLSEWLYRAVLANETLKLHHDYFRLRRPLERRLYELARKHCGNQEGFVIGLKSLHLKMGAKSKEAKTRQFIKDLEKTNHLPGYTVEYRPDRDQVIFTNRESPPPPPEIQDLSRIYLTDETLAQAKLLAPGADVYAIEQDWRAWAINQTEPIHTSPQKAFLGYIEKVWLKDERNRAVTRLY